MEPRLAYVLTIDEVSRFRRGKQLSYLGLIPREESSGRALVGTEAFESV